MDVYLYKTISKTEPTITGRFNEIHSPDYRFIFSTQWFDCETKRVYTSADTRMFILTKNMFPFLSCFDKLFSNVAALSCVVDRFSLSLPR